MFPLLSLLLLSAAPQVIAAGADYDFSAAIEEYRAAAESGDLDRAAAVAREVCARMAEDTDSPAWRTADRRLALIRDAALRTDAKLDLIAAGAGAPSPFAYVAPSPAELAAKLSLTFSATRLNYQGLDESEREFVKSAEATALAAADSAVLESYRRAVAAGEGEGAETARAFLSAYVLAAHAADLPVFLERLSREVADSGIVLLVVEDAVTRLDDLSAASRCIDALDTAGWYEWPAGKRRQLIDALAKKALDSGRYNWAVTAHAKLAADSDPSVAEPALVKVIDLHAEEAKALAKSRSSGDRDASRAAYGDAAAACREYLNRFPEGKEALNIEYRQSFYLYSAGKSAEAVTAARRFCEAHPDSTAVANAMLIEALATNDMGKSTEAIAIFERIVREYPQSSAAGRAQFMAGYCHLAMQDYVKARECFQKVVDFHPNDPTAPRARELLEKLENISKE